MKRVTSEQGFLQLMLLGHELEKTATIGWDWGWVMAFPVMKSSIYYYKACFTIRVRYGWAIFHPACDTAHWYNIMNSTYCGTSCTTEISYSVHGSSVAQDGMLLILELCPPSGSLSLTVGISIWGDTPASNIHHHIVMWKVTVYLCMCQRKM